MLIRFTGSMINISNHIPTCTFEKTDFLVSWASIFDKRQSLVRNAGFPGAHGKSCPVQYRFQFRECSYRFKIDQRHGKKGWNGKPWEQLT